MATSFQLRIELIFKINCKMPFTAVWIYLRKMTSSTSEHTLLLEACVR